MSGEVSHTKNKPRLSKIIKTFPSSLAGGKARVFSPMACAAARGNPRS